MITSQRRSFSQVCLQCMIWDRAQNGDPAYHLIEHMAMVAEDALEHSWECVRRGSNMVFDKVEKRRITWEDTQAIKEMRYAVFWLKSSKVIRDQVPCDSFNVDGKDCQLQDEHNDDMYTYRHRCDTCWYGLTLRDCKHLSNQCKRKKGMQYKYNEAQAYKEDYKYKEKDGVGQSYNWKPKHDNNYSKN